VISRKYAGLAESESDRILNLLQKSELPIAMGSQSRSEDFMHALRLDKKRVEMRIECVLIDHLGQALTRKFSFEEIFSVLA
jgi:3-dehydroquinate synthetase